MKRIRVGVIGCGNFVRNHVRAVNDHVPEFRIVALADRDRRKAVQLRKELLPRRRVEIHEDHRKMLAEADLQAVIISTPHTLHYIHARDALAAGCNVLIEKPMVTSSTNARRLVRKAERAGLDLQVAIQGTYTDTFAYARKLLTDGTMGDLQLATGIMAQGWLAGTAGTWRQNPKLSGGGQLYDSTAHVLSAMVFLVDSPVVRAHCWIRNKGASVDINAVATMEFANGCMATITSGGNCPTFYSHLILQGDNAFLEISPHGGSFRVDRKRPPLQITSVPRGWSIPTVTPARNFADVILGRDKPRCTGELGVRLAELMDALYDSAERESKKGQ